MGADAGIDRSDAGCIPLPVVRTGSVDMSSGTLRFEGVRVIIDGKVILRGTAPLEIVDCEIAAEQAVHQEENIEARQDAHISVQNSKYIEGDFWWNWQFEPEAKAATSRSS